MNNNDKNQIVEELQTMRTQVQKARLKTGGDMQALKHLDEADRELGAKLEQLRNAMHRDWQGQAKQVWTELNSANKRIEEHCRDIDKAVGRAEKAVKILGQVEDMMKKLTGLLS